MRKKRIALTAILLMVCVFCSQAYAWGKKDRQVRKKQQLEKMQKQFEWWPTDAQPAPVPDEDKGGYWWWPTSPGEARPWGNRGYIYVYKIIYDYKAKDDDVVEPPKPSIQVVEAAAPVKVELKPSLLIKKIIRNVKIYFDYNKADLRDDHLPILNQAVKTLQRNPEADILITGNCDARGSDEYNLKLGKKRGEIVEKFMLENGVPENRIKIISRGKLDAVAPISDLVGMQKDRNAQFMIAEVEEVMIPEGKFPEDKQVKSLEEGKYLLEKKEDVTSQVKVSTREYVIQKDDSLSKIAQKELGKASRWKYLYELNKDRIKDPNKLKAGVKIIIPIE